MYYSFVVKVLRAMFAWQERSVSFMQYIVAWCKSYYYTIRVLTERGGSKIVEGNIVWMNVCRCCVNCEVLFFS